MNTCFGARSQPPGIAAYLAVLAVLWTGMRLTAAETAAAAPATEQPAPGTDTSRGVSLPSARPLPPSAPAKPPYARVHVLCIGINSTPDAPELPSLAYAEEDARSMADRLRTSYRFTTTLLLGPQATKQGIEAAVQAVRQSLQPDDDFILYFAGHGATAEDLTKIEAEDYERTGFLIPASARLGRQPSFPELQHQAIDMKALARSLCDVKARHRLLILDCCFSGYATQFKQRKEVKYSPDMLAHPTVQIITAGTDKEMSIEFADLRHGVFTFELLELLTSPEDYSLDEVFIPLRRAVVRHAENRGRTLTPTLRSLIESDGDFVFVPAERQDTWAARAAAGSTRPTGVGRGATSPVTEQEVLLATKVEEGSVKTDDPEWRARVDRYEERAAVGDPNAMAALVQLYGKGVGTAKNTRKADQWAREGFDSGTPVGKAALASALQFGYGGRIDINGASLIAAVLPAGKLTDPIRLLLGGTSGGGSAGSGASGGGITVVPGLPPIQVPNFWGGSPKDPAKILAKELESLSKDAAKIEEDLSRNRYVQAQRKATSLEGDVGKLSGLTGKGVAPETVQAIQDQLRAELATLTAAINSRNKDGALSALLQFNASIDQLTRRETKR